MDLLRQVRAHSRILDETARFISEGDRVLDLGCGTGLLTEHLPHTRLAYRGIDVSPDFIRIGRDRYEPRPGLSFEVADATRLEIGTGTYDVVTLLNLLHLPGIHAPALLRRALAALKPGGRLVFSGPRSPESLIRMDLLLIDPVPSDARLAGQEGKRPALSAVNPLALREPGYYCSAEGMDALLRHLGCPRTLAARNDLADGQASFVVAQK